MPGGDPNALLNKAYEAGSSATAEPQAGADRQGTIRTLGIIQIVMGGISGLLAAVIAVVSIRSHQPPLASTFYVLAAANLLVTGIGSVRIAPWARRATLISAWIWLCLMVLSIAGLVFGLLLRDSGMGPRERALAGAIVAAVALVALGLPILFIAQYTRPAVRATFEARRRHTS